MARLNLSFLAAFLVLAVCALSLPTRRDSTQGLTLHSALEGIESAAKLLHGLDNKNSNDQDNEAQKAKPTTTESDQRTQQSNDEDNDFDQPTRTQKKPTSGKFVTPTATHTHHSVSKPNMLGKIPIVGGLLGGTGGSL